VDPNDPRVLKIAAEIEADLTAWVDDAPVIGRAPVGRGQSVSADELRPAPTLFPDGLPALRVATPRPVAKGDKVLFNGVEHIITEVTCRWSEDKQCIDVSYKAMPTTGRVFMTARLADPAMLMPDWVPASAPWSRA
jgi:hypothetical protein